MNLYAKVSLIVLLSATFAGCNKGAEPTNELSKSKLPEVTVPPEASVAVTPQWIGNHQVEINRMEKQLCEDCGPESSECEVEDYYEFPLKNMEVKRLIVFREGGHGPNASYEVILSTKGACTVVLEPSGTSINFISKADKNEFPDIGVSSHWSVEESVDTGYHWDGKKYVSEGSVKKNARTGAEEVLR